MKLSLLFLLLLSGCAAKKTNTARPPMAHIVIPSDCIMDIQSTKLTKCEQLPEDAFRAACDKVIVHFRCTKAVKN